MRQGARLGSKVNASESVIIPVTGNKPKMLRGLTKRFVGGLNITPLFCGGSGFLDSGIS
jgi:hypothetical protein